MAATITGTKYKPGMRQHPLYKVWRNIKKDTVYEEWQDFMKFYEWGITRWFQGSCTVNTDGAAPYSPDNLKFITRDEFQKIVGVGNKVKNKGIKRSPETLAKRKKTNLAKYGVENTFQLESTKAVISTNRDVKEKKNGMKKDKVKVGAEFGRLTVEEPPFKAQQKRGNGVRRTWRVKCRCTCGNEYTTNIGGLLRGFTQSCGCLHSKIIIQRNQDSRKYPIEIKNHTLYDTWGHLTERDKEICDEWSNYLNFYDWAIKLWQPGLRLVMIDRSLTLCPENCKFVTLSEATTESQQYNEYRRDEINAKVAQTKMDRYGDPFYVGNTKLGEQNEVRDWLLSLGYEFNSNHTIIPGQEIDLYNDELKLGVEYCGLKWHHERTKDNRGRQYHYNKFKKCEEQGIRLITIFSDEWKNRNQQVKNFLMATLGKFDRRYYARKCTVQEVDSNIARDFIEQNHIQGAKNSSRGNFGLFLNDELLGVLTLNPHHRDNSKWTLNRLAFLGGVQVVGGGNKLLSPAIKWCQQNGIPEVISWSDNRWSVGNVYEKCGFTLDGNLGPDYGYVSIRKPTKRYSKQSMKKSKVKCPDGITEKEWANTIGYARIWDCGKKRWVINTESK